MNKLFSIALIITLSLPVAIQAADDVSLNEEAQNEIVNTIDDEIDTIEEAGFEHKEPIGKKKIIKKFLVAMGGVAASSFILYFGLTTYNRIRENLFKQKGIQVGESSLESPENYEEAVKTFLEKTNWS